jgi:hypothetical protein
VARDQLAVAIEHGEFARAPVGVVRRRIRMSNALLRASRELRVRALYRDAAAGGFGDTPVAPGRAT